MFTQPGWHELSGVGASWGGRMPGREYGIGGLPPSNLGSPIVNTRISKMENSLFCFKSLQDTEQKISEHERNNRIHPN